MVANVILPQAGATRITRIAKETAPEVLPTTPAFDILRNTGGAGSVPNVETVTSSELSGSSVLGIRDVIRVSTLGQADYNYELSYGTPFDILLESLLQNEFGLNPDGTSSGSPDQLVPGSATVTFSVEDDFSDIKDTIYLQGGQTTNFSISIVAGQIVTGTATIQSTLVDVNTTTTIADPTVSFDGTNSEMTVSVSLPTNIAVGNYVQVTGSVSNDGYYEITNIAGLVITLAGQLTTEGPVAVTLGYQGESLLDQTSGTVNSVATTEAFKAGNNINAEISTDGGTTWVDTLNFGYRFQQADITLATESNNLSEITEDQPFAILAVNRTVEITLSYYLINLDPIEKILGDQEFGLRFRLTDTASNFYQFTFPRMKSSAADPGEAALGSEMVGTWSVQGLLNSNDLLMIVDRA